MSCKYTKCKTVQVQLFFFFFECSSEFLWQSQTPIIPHNTVQMPRCSDGHWSFVYFICCKLSLLCHGQSEQRGAIRAAGRGHCEGAFHTPPCRFCSPWCCNFSGLNRGASQNKHKWGKMINGQFLSVLSVLLLSPAAYLWAANAEGCLHLVSRNSRWKPPNASPFIKGGKRLSGQRIPRFMPESHNPRQSIGPFIRSKPSKLEYIVNSRVEHIIKSFSKTAISNATNQ